jgi:anti-sigma factor RsiW
MKCEELLAALNDYVDGTLEPGVCESFEEHLQGCNPCQVVVDNIRGTITLYRAGEPYEMPPEFHDRLRQALREKWRAKFRQPATQD